VHLKKKKTNGYFLFTVFVEPLDSICTNALAKSLQIFWQALLVGDRHTGFAPVRLVAWLLLILGPGKWWRGQRENRKHI